MVLYFSALRMKLLIKSWNHGVSDPLYFSKAGLRVAPVVYSELLLEQCRQAGLVTDEELEKQRFLLPGGKLQPKLHVTLINTKLRRDEERKSADASSSRIPIDATTVMDQLGDKEIASATIDQIHLSKRGPFASNGYYQCELSIPLWQ